MLRQIIGVALLACAAVLPARAATRIEDPAKFVRQIYENFIKNPDHYLEPEDFYTPRLKALWADERRDAGNEEGRIDFDPWADAQATDLKSVDVTTETVESRTDRLVVIAKFTNLGAKEETHFYFERGSKGWLLDDIRSLRGTGWTLSTILKYGEDSDPNAK